MARMARLAAPATTALRASAALTRLAREPIRRRRLGGDGRVLLAERQAALQLRNLLRLLGQLTAQLGVFTISLSQRTTQSLDRPLVRLAALRHASDGTPLPREVQGG